MADSDSPTVWSDPTAPGAQPPTTGFDKAAIPVDQAATPPVPPAPPPDSPPAQTFPPAQAFPPAQVSPAATPPAVTPPGFPAPPAYSPPTEFSVGAAPLPPPPPAPPAFSAPDASYTASPYPVTAPPSPQYGGYGGYGGYGVQPAVGYPGFAPQPKTNGMAIAAMVTSIVGAALLACYGFGGIIGVVGAILGHVARKQIRERQESGGGMALAGIIIGWIATGLALIFVAALVIFIAWAANQPTTGPGYGTGFNAIGLVRASLS